MTKRPESYDRLIAEHGKLIHKVAYRLFDRDHDDAVQDIHVDLLRKWDKFDGIQYKFSTWVWVIGLNVRAARRQYAEANKRLGRIVSIDADTVLPSTPPSQHEYAELSETLRRLSGTRDSQALMRIAMGDELREVAADLGLSRERVRQLAERERGRLREVA